MATEWYLSVGRGFHSNDARGVTQHVDVLSGAPVDPVDPLVASVGSEIGLKTQWWGSWNIAASLWYLELDSELTFVGDAGTTEANRSSQRKGIELNNFWAINDIWSLEADFAWTDSQFSHRATEGNDIPGALGTVISTTLSAQLPSGWFGSLRVRYLGRAPLIENGTVQASSTVLSHLTAGWSGKRYALRADILNLLNSDDRDIEYYYASRLAGEPPEGIEDRHFHTFEPRQVRLTISLNL
jgi:outer membrane receptor protein involved in Fe transport